MEFPSQVNAHSIRVVSTSWAVRANVSLETICRAGTWSSNQMFFRHYHIDPGALTTVEFRRTTVQVEMSLSK